MNYELQGYLDRFNHMRELFDLPNLVLENDLPEIRAMMEAEGDPATLSGDGEYSREIVENRAKIWYNAMNQLDAFEKERG